MERNFVFKWLFILATIATNTWLVQAGRLPRAGGNFNINNENKKHASETTEQPKHIKAQDDQENEINDKNQHASKEAFNKWQQEQYDQWKADQQSSTPTKTLESSDDSEENTQTLEDINPKREMHGKTKTVEHEILDDAEEEEKEKMEDEELSVLSPKVVEEEPELVELEKPTRPQHTVSDEEREQQELMKKHNKQWREKHPGRKQERQNIDQWQQEQNALMAQQRKQWEQDTFDEREDDDTEMKAKMADEAEELRVLEPHVETHNKAQKEEIKEHDAHKDEVVDMLNPEEVLHDGEKHAHDTPTEGAGPEEAKHEGEHGDGDDEEECEDCRKAREAEEKAERELKAKLSAEAEELRVLEPHVETHSKVEKKVEELLKHQQFSAGDIEGAVHGGGHVHGDHDQEQAGARDVDGLVVGVSKEQKAESHGDIGVEDPETLMHGAEGHEHGGQTGKPVVGLHVPEDVKEANGDFAHDDSVVKMKVKKDEKAEIGVGLTDLEKAVHGEEGNHVHEGAGRPGKKITMQDILKLGLSEKELRGVDLSKIMEQDQREYEKWQNGDDEEDDDDDDNSNGFWGQMSQIRKNYLDGLAARIRNIGVPDLENAEWDNGQLDDQEMPTGNKNGHPGESSLEHEMEMWANTAPKGESKNLHGAAAPNTE